MSRRTRLLAGLGLVLVLVATGAFVGVRYLLDQADRTVRQADLFGAGPSSTPGMSPSPSASPTPLPGADITGPLNILIVGVDTRVSVPGWQPHADAVMIMHVTKALDQAYLVSLPRDLVVQIPAFPKAHFGGARTKLTHAMSYGSRVPGSSKADPAQGFQLLAKTVSNYTGIARFDAGAILTFGGLRNLTDAVGGFNLYVDQRVVSIHVRPDGKPRTLTPGALHGYTGPQKVYNVGMHHFVGWEAIDYARQRYTAGSDYTRQRHQRQIIKAIITQAFRADIVTDPVALNRVLKAIGSALVFDGRGHRVIDFAFALRHINGAAITLVGLPGTGVYVSGNYRGERLLSIEAPFFAAVRKDAIGTFLRSHPELVNRTP